MAATETSARANAVLDELYREHVGDVYRYTYAVLGNHADAEDVTQTTFVNALRALERGETPEDPSRWLTVIAHNLVRQRWRQAAARPTLVELETDVADAQEDEEAFELEELVRALQRIPETQREAIVMRELEGRSYREIAMVMGLSTSALETLLFRARRSLAEELENVVTCQNAELALSKSIDGRLSRKERRRLDEHLADCPDCARLAATQQRRRRAFKGLALLPLPIGLALFKGAPSAAAATSLPTIGLGTAGAGTSGTGAAGAAGAGATAATTSGGAAVGGSLAAGLVVKVAAVVVTATVAAGVGYKGVQAVRQTPAKTPPASVKKTADKAGTPSGAVAPRVTHTADVKKAAVEAKGHGKPVSSPGRAKHGAPPPPGLATSQAAKEPGNNAGHASSGVGTGAKPHPAGGAGPKHTDSPAKPKTPASGNDAAKPNGGKGPQAGGNQGHAQDTDAPEAPKTPKTPKAPASGGGSGGPAAPGQGGDTTSPTAAGSAPTGGAPATSGATTGSTSPTEQPPASTPPPSTPSTPPTTTPPPTEQTPPSGSTETPPDPSDAHSNNGWDDGKKLGHYKENQDGKHLVTP
jgi:RNA polymerase sigma factor (sigma-70 family)